jgi:hypothetical protein
MRGVITLSRYDLGAGVVYTGCNILHEIGVIYEDHREGLRPFVSGLQVTPLCCTALVHWRKCDWQDMWQLGQCRQAQPGITRGMYVTQQDI